MPMISFGIYSRHYKYILLSLVYWLLFSMINGLNYNDVFETIRLRISPNQIQKKFEKHELIHQIFCYFGTCVMSLIFYNYEKKRYSNPVKQPIKIENNNDNNLISEEKSSNRSLIYSRVYNRSSLSVKYFLFIIFIFLLMDQVIHKYEQTLSHLDFWMFELIIISYLNLKINKIQIFKHQKFVLVFSIFPALLKIVTIYFSFIGDQSTNNNNKYLNKEGHLKYIYVVYWYLVPIGILMFLAFISLRSFTIIKMKYFMDLKYISEYRLLIFYGLIGTIFYSIICIVTTFLKCNDNAKELNIKDYFCKIEKNNITYFESFSVYFTTTKEVKEILFEIAVVLLGMLTFFYYKYNSIMIIKYLSPAHVIFLIPIYYFLSKIVLMLINTLCYLTNKINKIFNWDSIHYAKEIFTLDILGDFFSLIGFLIYLEIIEIDCWKLDYNSRKNIMNRSREESMSIEDDELYRCDSLTEDDLNDINRSDSNIPELTSNSTL